MKIYTVKKTSRNTVSYFIDTLENLTARLEYFIIEAKKRKKRGEPEQPAVYHTIEDLLTALNESAIRSGSSEIKYEVVE